jgi:hypothetical protein
MQHDTITTEAARAKDNTVAKALYQHLELPYDTQSSYRGQKHRELLRCM